jgi:hypothetical protein
LLAPGKNSQNERRHIPHIQGIPASPKLSEIAGIA